MKKTQCGAWLQSKLQSRIERGYHDLDGFLKPELPFSGVVWNLERIYARYNSEKATPN